MFCESDYFFPEFKSLLNIQWDVSRPRGNSEIEICLRFKGKQI